MNTLIICTGNARGGETTWETLYKNVMDVYEADLAVSFGEDDSDISLYKKAKYIWPLPEYKNWSDYYNQNVENQFCIKSFKAGKHSGLAGGLDDHIGSGAIVFAFRHFLKAKYSEVLRQYDRIILTRSDHFYTRPHEILSNDNIWIIEGENYEGITDRHHIFPSKYLDEMLGVIDYMNTETGHEEISKYRNPNAEIVLNLSFSYFNISHLIKRFKRFQFTVATKQDSTRWAKGKIPLPNYENLYIKYPSEYDQTIQNTK